VVDQTRDLTLGFGPVEAVDGVGKQQTIEFGDVNAWGTHNDLRGVTDDAHD